MQDFERARSNTVFVLTKVSVKSCSQARNFGNQGVEPGGILQVQEGSSVAAGKC